MAASLKMKRTTDPLQHTTNFDLSERLLWRKVLLWRYYEDLGSRDDLLVQWSDFNLHHKIVAIEDESNSTLTALMASKRLFKTIIQVAKTDKSKLITITAFYSTGTLLVQGYASETWTANEFQKVIKSVDHLKNNDSANYQSIMSVFTANSDNRACSPPQNGSDTNSQCMQSLAVQEPAVSFPESQDSAVTNCQSEGEVEEVFSGLDIFENSDLQSPGHLSLPQGQMFSNVSEEPIVTRAEFELLKEELRAANESILALKKSSEDLSAKLETNRREQAVLRNENEELRAALKAERTTSQRMSTPQGKQDFVTPRRTVRAAGVITRGLITTSNRFQALPVEVEEPMGPSHEERPIQRAHNRKKESILIVGDSHTRNLVKGKQCSIPDAIAVVNPRRKVEDLDLSVVSGHKNVVLIAGSNNIGSKERGSIIAGKLEGAINCIQERNPHCRLFVQEILPRHGECHDITMERNTQLANTGIRRICERKGVQVLSNSHYHREDFTRHGLHLNSKGKCKLAEIIKRHTQCRHGDMNENGQKHNHFLGQG